MDWSRRIVTWSFTYRHSLFLFTFIRFPFVFVDQTNRKQPQYSGGVWVTKLSLPHAIVLQRDRLEILCVCAERKRWCFEETATLIISGSKREDLLYKSNIFLSVNNIDLRIKVTLSQYMIQTFPLLKQVTLLSCLLDTGLYHNKVTLSLTPN